MVVRFLKKFLDDRNFEEGRKEVESDLEQAIRKGRSCGMSNREITEVFQIILEDQG